jgi:hypothetical protein
MSNTDAKTGPPALPADWRVVDVGGGASPFKRADYVIDGLSYDERGKLDGVLQTDDERFGPESWTQLDLCEHKPWPFSDNQFDYATCTHVLEDVRDPVWVCSEISRIAKAGYIETPSRVVEQSLGVEHPLYAGYYHHRWLVEEDDGCLLFRLKPHSLHSLRGAIVARVGIRRRINPVYANTSLEWRDAIPCEEVLSFDEVAVNHELCESAARWRSKPDLVVPTGLPPSAMVRRFAYHLRLRMGRA